MQKNSNARERTLPMNPMKAMRILFVLLSAAALALPVLAQDKPAPEPAVAYRVQVVLSEFDGANKVSSLPYTIPTTAINGDARSSLRVGIRVPVNTSTKTGETAITYTDVGTNLDVHVKRSDSERYAVDLTLDRSWLYVRDANKDGKVEGRPWVTGDPVPSLAPLNHQFRTNVAFLLRDGHPSETAVATDPVTGHVMKVDVTLSVVK
jgi:hypothetical protein